MHRKWMTLSICVLLFILAVKFLWSYFVPPFFDEAYYISWAENLDWGYLDHPPGVAFLSALGFGSTNFFLARLPSLILALLSIWPFINICRIIGIKQRDEICLVLALFFGSFGGILYGIVTLPDVGMTFFWIVGTQELLRALNGEDIAWFTTGLCVGLGFLCKYIMILFLPVIFITILLGQPSYFKKPKLWLGFLFFILTISPHLAWNANNNWVSFKFQFNRGLFNTHPQSNDATKMPQKMAQTSYEDFAIASRLIDPLDVEKKIKKKEKNAWERFSLRQSEYWTAVFFIWGLLFFPISFAIFKKEKREFPGTRQQKICLSVLTWLPMSFFAVVSLFTKVEGNWVSIYTIGAAVLIASTLKLRPAAFIASLTLNASLIAYVLFATVFSPNLNTPVRILKETGRYNELFNTVAQRAYFPVFAERYQLASEINYFAQDILVHQFPGLQRDSELTRNKSIPIPTKKFSIVSESFPPPSFEGFKIEKIFEFRKCRNGDYQIREAVTNDHEPICRKKDKAQIIYILNYRMI